MTERHSWAAETSEIDEYICLKCEDVVPQWIRAKHFAGKEPRPEKHGECKAACLFDSKPVQSVVVFCGKRHEGHRKSKLPKGSKAIADMEDGGYSEKQSDDQLLYFVDKDTPCSVIIHGDPKDPETEAREVAIGHDVAKALTPEVVARRRTVAAIVWEQDNTGERAKAALAAWPKEMEATKQVVTIAAGFPKVIDHKGKPELPEGKQSLLLGYCPNEESGLALGYLRAPFPGAEGFTVAAAGTVLSCPTPVHSSRSQAPVSRSVSIAGKDLSAVAFITTVPSDPLSGPYGGERMFVYAFLRDKTGHLIDSKVEELAEGRGGYLESVSMPRQKGRLSVRLMVNMGDVKCRGRNNFSRTVDITVDGDKIVTKTTEGEMPDCDCPGC